MLQIERGGIEVREHAHLASRIRLGTQHVEFFADGERRRQVPGRRKVAIVDDDAPVEDAPRMVVEIAPHHLTELRPLVEGRDARVGGNDPFSILFHE